MKPNEILLVEDNSGDVRLIREALNDGKVSSDLYVVHDGVEALAFLRRNGEYASVPRPDLILLDLNLPKKDGCEVLTIVKADNDLKTIPAVVLTTSQANEDVLKAYSLNANCYITKPVDVDDFMRVVRCIEEFWLLTVKLPQVRD